MERRKFVRLGKSSETVSSDAGIRDMGIERLQSGTEIRKHHTAAATANQKILGKNTTSKAIKKQTPSLLLLFSLKKPPPKFPRIPRKISQTSPLRHLNPRLRTPQTTPRNHHLRTPSLNSALQHILEIVLVDLFPVVDPAVDWVREIDTDLVGCLFRVMIRGGGGVLRKRGGRL